MSTRFIEIREGAAYHVTESGWGDSVVDTVPVVVLARRDLDVDWRALDGVETGTARIFAGMEQKVDRYLKTAGSANAAASLAEVEAPLPEVFGRIRDGVHLLDDCMSRSWEAAAIPTNPELVQQLTTKLPGFTTAEIIIAVEVVLRRNPKSGFTPILQSLLRHLGCRAELHTAMRRARETRQ